MIEKVYRVKCDNCHVRYGRDFPSVEAAVRCVRKYWEQTIHGKIFCSDYCAENYCPIKFEIPDDMKAEGFEIKKEDIERAFKGTNFGNVPYEVLIKEGVLKCALGFLQGATLTVVLRELGLVGNNYVLSNKGRAFLKLWFVRDLVI